MHNVNNEFFKATFKKILADSVLSSVGQEDINYELHKGDSVDQSLGERDCNLEHRLKGRTFIYLKKIKEALFRIQEGSFGECHDCGCDINSKRLIARPMATRCISCKEEEETDNNKMFNKNRYSAKRLTTNSLNQMAI